jgi:transcriptional regulator with XRE-family HTH domain
MRAMSTPPDRLRQARKDAGFATATAAAESLGISRDTYIQHENGNRPYDYDSAKHYSRRFNTTPEWLLDGRGSRHARVPRIEIVGFVGADSSGQVLFATGQGTSDTVPPPPSGSLTAKALEVRGHSMPFVAEDGSIIYFDDQRTAVPPELLSKVVVCELDTEEVLIKRLLRGSKRGHYDLESIGAPTRHDVRINWVARIVGILPPDEARRLIQRGTEAA